MELNVPHTAEHVFLAWDHPVLPAGAAHQVIFVAA